MGVYSVLKSSNRTSTDTKSFLNLQLLIFLPMITKFFFFRFGDKFYNNTKSCLHISRKRHIPVRDPLGSRRKWPNVYLIFSSFFFHHSSLPSSVGKDTTNTPKKRRITKNELRRKSDQVNSLKLCFFSKRSQCLCLPEKKHQQLKHLEQFVIFLYCENKNSPRKKEISEL